MIQLECLPYGVGHADEGVCLLVRMGPYRILLDCGLPDVTPLLAAGSAIDLVLCSHAHADHARGLWALHQACPALPIYASEVTTHLLPLNWIADHPIPPFCHALPWRSPVEFQEGLTVELFPAGHLPGAAVILLTYTPPSTARPYTLLYTGDFFLSNSRLVEGLRLEELRGLAPDVLIVEGSYGTARYPHRRQQENQLAERISQAIADQQSVLLPLPTLGLGQELLMLLRSHHLFTGRDLNIWVDGTVVDGCNAYLELVPHLPASVQNFARYQSLFWDERVRPCVRPLPPEQRGTVGQVPCIVLTDQTTDLWEFCQPHTRPWLVLLPQSLDPQWGGGPEKWSQDAVISLPSPAPPTASTLSVDTYRLAQHCDGPSTTQLIHNLRPQHVVFVHGTANYLADLTALDELHNRYHLHAPTAGSLVALPIGETFLQPAAPETSYEGELAELGTVVTITFPEGITADSRWRSLADTGVVEARWQGDELVLRGLPQRELLNPGPDRRSTRSEAGWRSCCLNCRHYRGQRCWNPASPLFNFKVTPEGYCPAFEVIAGLSENRLDEPIERSQ